jgi:hypothetical protein
LTHPQPPLCCAKRGVETLITKIFPLYARGERDDDPLASGDVRVSQLCDKLKSSKFINSASYTLIFQTTLYICSTSSIALLYKNERVQHTYSSTSSPPYGDKIMSVSAKNITLFITVYLNINS